MKRVKNTIFMYVLAVIITLPFSYYFLKIVGSFQNAAIATFAVAITALFAGFVLEGKATNGIFFSKLGCFLINNGTRKTILWNDLSAEIISKGNILYGSNVAIFTKDNSIPIRIVVNVNIFNEKSFFLLIRHYAPVDNDLRKIIKALR